MAAAIAAMIPCAEGAASCSVPAAGSLAFTYNVFSSTPAYANGSAHISCKQNNVPVTVSLDSGANSTTVNPRKMKLGSDLLAYLIYSDSGYTTLFGNGSNGGSTLVVTTGVKNVSFPITLYGEITAGQDVGQGPYSDTINVTFSF